MVSRLCIGNNYVNMVVVIRMVVLLWLCTQAFTASNLVCLRHAKTEEQEQRFCLRIDMQLRFYPFECTQLISEHPLVLLEKTLEGMIRSYRKDLLPVKVGYGEPVTAQQAGSLAFHHQEWQLGFLLIAVHRHANAA